MIDLHCHMLPGIDDGARDLESALRMAELAVADGITMTACTPHIYPGLFENTHAGIREAVASFREELKKANIPLELTYGADIQVVPDLVRGLQDGTLPSLNSSRYFLFEPPHHVPLPRMADLIHNALLAGYVPVITHPERLTYIESDFDKFVGVARAGAWIQLTGGSLLGRFGPRVKKIAERFLEEGYTHLLASDGHNLKNRTPELREARDAAALIVGEEEADRLVQGRPAAIIANTAPGEVPLPWGLDPEGTRPFNPSSRQKGWFARFFSGE
ncbi:capsular biosynthesis protein [Halioglobus japonicus]|uniref:protein-tyrosine-phosphatase n=1 Tax=Halioglobus japonicus TaxID=930805 RepID=A0AAP8MBJ7_9GAMM|nr:CpsB/CapC family capsule biosynthesis tyrosine phosphatase [Halioglobus japonicus]AQA16890.1 capsular biosynthesis protein [Halioglobus japonicus]PLW84776.1 capsular biosynthesis protein [Halioglobus japonicus]GHD21366.1 tyrosine protein phosphatase [Halioglobus japonicus]